MGTFGDTFSNISAGNSLKPKVLTASISETYNHFVSILFNSNLNTSSIPSTTDFSITGKTIVAVVISGAELRLHVNPYFIYSDVVTVSYAKPVSNQLKTSVAVDSFSGQVVVNNCFNPNSVSGQLASWDASNVTNVGGFADTLIDTTGSSMTLQAPGATNRPLIVVANQNGYPALSFDGINDRLNKTTGTISVPFTVYMASKLNTYVNGKTLLSSYASPFSQIFSQSNSSFQGVYFGTNMFMVPVQPKTNNAVSLTVINGVSSRYNYNGEILDGNSGATTYLQGVTLGSNSNLDGGSINSIFWEAKIFSGAHDTTTQNKMFKYMSDKYNIPTNVFDGVFTNSVLYTDKTSYKIRNPFDEINFSYSGTLLQLTAVTSYYPYVQSHCTFTIYINGVFNQTVQMPAIPSIDVVLPAGYKNIKIVEATEFRSGDAGDNFGTYMTSLLADSSYVKIPETVIPEKVVFIGDSITVGFATTNPARQAYGRLFYEENNKTVAFHGWSVARLFSMAETAPKIATTVGYITSLFANVTTTKKLCILLGTNDYAMSATAAATISAWYGALLDAINAADNTIHVYCISPTRRTGDPALVADYRTAISALCAARTGFTTYINGYNLLDLSTDFSDGIHPTVAGQKKLKDAIYPILFP